MSEWSEQKSLGGDTESKVHRSQNGEKSLWLHKTVFSRFVKQTEVGGSLHHRSTAGKELVKFSWVFGSDHQRPFGGAVGERDCGSGGINKVKQKTLLYFWGWLGDQSSMPAQ